VAASSDDAKGPELSQGTIHAGTLAKYAGTYDYVSLGGTSQVVVISVSDGRLFFDQNNAGAQKLLPSSEKEFSLCGWHITFVTDSRGAVTHVLGQAAEGETNGVRRK
jgi:hypothetical protein